jgi:hypothetical protein
MNLNGVIFHAHCEYFEIKKEQIATPLISDYLYLNGVIFQELCVDFEGKLNK